MGVLSCLEPQYHLPIPDTPPGLVSPSSSSHSTRPSEDTRPWNLVAPISPPMSNYDQHSNAEMSSRKNSDETQNRRDAGQAAAPRQQLPSLSSLFGPPSSVRPLHSPHSEHPGSYPATSPLDRPLGSGTHGERSISSSSYFPSTPVASLAQPRSVFEPRLDDRSAFQPVNRAPFPGPLSPRSRESDHYRPESRSDYGHGSKWPLHQDVNRSEYSFSGRDSRGDFKSPQDQYLPQIAGQKRDPEGVILDFRNRIHINPLGPGPTSPSAMIGETIPTKDGLGPKIWTGTHFLPRFVRAAEVPGEGLCYFYDDGTHCKTVIDGEAVNAHWGVTKAGKPRKRLAIACVTCREKKIKCDPDYPRCVQCEKFGRVCKFKNAPRGGHNLSPSTPPAEPEEPPQRASIINSAPLERPRPTSHSGSSVSPRTTFKAPSPDAAGAPHKRMRLGYEPLPPPTTAPQRSPVGPLPSLSRSNMPWQQPELPRIHEDVLSRAWQTDPYVSDPQSVTRTASSFFNHLDCMALRFLPEKAFTAWLVQSNRAHNKKSPEDTMLVYSVLALGVALSGGPKDIAFEYAQVARYATEHVSGLSLQLVQARIVLSLYYLAVSRPTDANDMSSAAISAATCLQLNLEVEKSADASLTTYPFGLNRIGFAECRRRTFWACFILERLNGLFPARMSIINSADVFLRLPTDNLGFEEQAEVETPMFEPSSFATQDQQQGLGIMGYLTQVVAIWGEVMTVIYRLAHRDAYADFDFAKFVDDNDVRLDEWRASVPERLSFPTANLEGTPSGDRGSLMTMHMVYHMAMIKLHRHVPPRFLTSASKSRHARLVETHARDLLDMVCGLGAGLEPDRTPPLFTSFATMEAVDVLSAEGAVADLPAMLDKLGAAVAVLDAVGRAWEDAKVHKLAVYGRMSTLDSVRDQAEPSSTLDGVRTFMKVEASTEKRLPAGLVWQISEPLEARFPKEMDCIYTSLAQPPASLRN